jgi:hypothetical protein
MEKFKVTIPCKPYVKQFIELNFGSPADISKDRDLYDVFRSKLKKKSFRHEKVYSTFGKYSENIDIKISRDDFYRYGWELSRTDVVSFNRIMEGRVKILMYSIVGSHLASGMALTESIEYFQDNFSFPETVWPKEAIYKDCQRNLRVKKNELKSDISKIIDKICLAKLSFL